MGFKLHTCTPLQTPCLTVGLKCLFHLNFTKEKGFCLFSWGAGVYFDLDDQYKLEYVPCITNKSFLDWRDIYGKAVHAAEGQKTRDSDYLASWKNSESWKRLYHPQEENEASEVQHLTGNNLMVCLAKLSMKVPFIKDKEFIVDCCVGNTVLVARL